MPYKDPIKRREAHRKYMREVWYPANKAKHKKLTSENRSLYNKKVKELIFRFRANGCVVCREVEACCLQAHHLNKKNKDFTIGHATSKGYSIKRIIAELNKCICLCANCHFKVHAGLLVFKNGQVV